MGRRKAIILTSITILFLCSMGCQSAIFGKGICCYVGDVKLSDTTISVKLTFDNDTTGTLEISKSNKALGKNKIEEFYFASLEADTLTLTGEIFYDIKYLFKRGREKCYIYPLNASTDGVLFCDKSIRRIELKGKKETNADSLFLSRIINGDFFAQEHSEEQDYILVIRHCLSHTDETYDETLSEGYRSPASIFFQIDGQTIWLPVRNELPIKEKLKKESVSICGHYKRGLFSSVMIIDYQTN